MKKLCLCLLLLPSLLLTACGTKQEEKLFEDFSHTLADRCDLSFIGTLRCEYEDRSVDFQLRYEEVGDLTLISVLQPENIAGVCIELQEGKSVLECNSLVIDTGELGPGGLSPLTALPTLAAALRTGYAEAFRYEGDELVCTLVPEDGLKAEVWFEPESMSPTHAEIIAEDRVAVFCDIESWR